MNSRSSLLIFNFFIMNFAFFWMVGCNNQETKTLNSSSRNLSDFGIANVKEFPKGVRLLDDEDGRKIFVLQDVDDIELESILKSFLNRSSIVRGSELRSSSVAVINSALAAKKPNRLLAEHISEYGAFTWDSGSGRYRCHYALMENKDLYLSIVMPNVGDREADLSDW